MCRNIKTLSNFEPPATSAEIEAACLQFVRKISGTTKPSKVNQPVFDKAVAEVSVVVHEFLDSLVTSSAPRKREVEAAKAKARNAKRFGTGTSIKAV